MNIKLDIKTGIIALLAIIIGFLFYSKSTATDFESENKRLIKINDSIEKQLKLWSIEISKIQESIVAKESAIKELEVKVQHGVAEIDRLNRDKNAKIKSIFDADDNAIIGFLSEKYGN